MHPPVNDETEQLLKLYHALLDDVDLYAKQPDSPHNRRSFIRAVFAFVEGWTWRFKLWTLSVATKSTNSLSAAEKSVLAGQTFSVDDNGEIRARRLQISPSANLQLATRLAARCFNVNTPKPAESKAGWSRFNKAVKIRNRITHPNTESDLVVSDAELELVNHAFKWSVSIFALILIAVAEKSVSELGYGSVSPQKVDAKLNELRQRYTDAMSNVISKRDA